MNTQDLKTTLHESIENIDDVYFLNAMKNMVERNIHRCQHLRSRIGR